VHLTSEQGNSNAVWGEDPNDSEQDQQTDISSTAVTLDKEGLVILFFEPDVVEL